MKNLIFKASFYEKLKLLIIPMMLLTLGVGEMWGAPGARYYLIGDPKGDWNKADNYKIQTRYEKDGKYVFYIYAANNHYFRLKKDDNSDYGPSSDGSTDQGYGAYNTNAWKYNGTSGIVMFGADETSGRNGEHYPYVFWNKPTVQIKHKWNNTDNSWTAQNMEDKGNGKYEYIGKYSGSNATNCGIGSGGATMKYFTNATLVGSPAQGNDCLFEYNSSGYKGFGTQAQNTGSLTITKLCKITYNSNSATGGSAPSNQEGIKYNTSQAIQANSGGLYRTGYTFAGWNTKANGTGTDYIPGKSYTITGNLTLYAKWVTTDRTMYFYNKNDWSGTIYAHLWNTSPVTWSEKEWPGTAMTAHQDKIYRYDYASPVFSKVQFNANANDKKTGDLTIPDYDQAFYNLESNSWTRYIMVAAFPTETIAAVVGEQATVEPVVAWADGVPFYDIAITSVRASGSTNVNAIVAGTKLIVSGTAAGTATFTVTYKYSTTTITKTLKVKIMAGIPIQAKISTSDSHWKYTNIVKMHYWGTGIATSDLTMTWSKTEGGYHYFQALVPTGTDSKAKFLFYYDYMKDKDNNQWRQTNDVETTSSRCYTISYSGSESSHSNLSSSSGLCYTTYQVRVIMGSGDIYTSNIVNGSSSTISFFAPSNANEPLSYRQGTVTLEQNGVTKKTYAASTFSQSGVYTAKINTSNYALTNLALYSGKYYIRTDGATGGWDNYKVSGKDNGMTYFTRNVNFPNETFSYYWVKNVAKSTEVNIKATVANDYNPILCNFSPDEKVTGDENGVNIRFGYEPTTNDIVRGILKGSTTNNFLNIIGEDGNIYKESARTTCLNEARYTSNPEDSKLEDMSDWVYGRVVYAYVANTSSTADVVLKANFNGVHYLLGMQKDASGHETSTPITYRVIKAGTTAPRTYPLRVVYDFKTNRLFGAWAPEGTLDVTGTLNVDADVIFLRHETEDVAQINIQTNVSKVDKIEHAIFALEVENDASKTLKNRELHYFISLPFDCKVSNIFGIGKFMTYWGIQKYRGDLRAEKGWFVETPTFWEWLDADDVMQKGEGYLLSIDKKALETGGQWKEYGGKSQLTLYFPSTSAGFSISQATGDELTITYPDQPCTIERDSRDKKDSNWKCIGTPGFKNIGVTDYTPQAGEKWYNDPPKFLYVFSEQTTSSTYKPGTYTATNGRTFTYHSFMSYMVQYAGTINWAVYSKGSDPSSISAKRVPFETEKKTKLQLDLIGEDGTSLDRTFVWLQEDATLGFDQNLDLNKIIESSANQIYSLAESDVPFAANVLPLETDTVRLVVNIAQDGEYTFSLPEEEHSGMAPVLYDMFRNEKINLLQTDYLVDLEQGKYEDRFYLLFQPEAPIVTSFETTNDGGQQTHSGEAIYDVLGRRVNTVYPGHLYIVNGHKRIAR